MSSNEEKVDNQQSKVTMTRVEAEQIRTSAKKTMYVSIAVVLMWLYGYNIVVHDMGLILAFFKVLDGINELVIGMLTVLGIGIGIVAVFTLTNFFTQIMTNMYSTRIIEDLVRDHLLKGEYRIFFTKMINFNEQPTPPTPFPRYVSSALFVFTGHYLVSWFYLIVFSECLYFAAWSAGVYLEFFPETMNIIPMFAVAVPFTARLMAYFKYPYVEEYAGFIPGILFVVVLLLAFVAYMNGPFDSLIFKELPNREAAGFFVKGALVWKFFKDGVIIAFYPVFGEIVFFYLLYQELQNQPLPCEETVLVESVDPIEPIESSEAETAVAENSAVDAPSPTEGV